MSSPQSRLISSFNKHVQGERFEQRLRILQMAKPKPLALSTGIAAWLRLLGRRLNMAADIETEVSDDRLRYMPL